MSRHGLGCAAIALSLFLVVIPALAQDSDSENQDGVDASEQAQDLYAAHDYAGAERFYRAGMAAFQRALNLSDDSGIAENYRAARNGLTATLIKEGLDLEAKAATADHDHNAALALDDMHSAIAYFQQADANQPSQNTRDLLSHSATILQNITQDSQPAAGEQ